MFETVEAPRLVMDEDGRGPSHVNKRVLAAARVVLRERPFSTVSVDDIARAAGLSRRTVYNRFASKEELFRACREQMIIELSATIEENIPIDQEPAVALRDFLCLNIRTLTDARHIEVLASIVRDGQENPWLSRCYERHVRNPLVRAVENYLLHRSQKGELAGLDPRIGAIQFLSTVEAIVVWPRLLGHSEPATNGQDTSMIVRMAAAFIENHFSRRTRRSPRVADDRPLAA